MITYIKLCLACNEYLKGTKPTKMMKNAEQ